MHIYAHSHVSPCCSTFAVPGDFWAHSPRVSLGPGARRLGSRQKIVAVKHAKHGCIEAACAFCVVLNTGMR